MKKGFRKKSIGFLLAGIFILTGIFQQGIVYGKEQAVKTYRLKISYYMEDTSKAIATSYEAVLPEGEEYSVDSPEIEGYALEKKEQETISGDLKADTEIHVFYKYSTQEAAYTVNYIGRSVDGRRETILKTFHGTAEIDSVVNAENEVFPGYIREPADLSLTVTADGKAVKNLYYTVKTNPCIIFNTNGYEIPIISEEPGTDISKQMAEIPTPTRQGYEFLKWDKSLPTKMPEEDLIINAVWEPGESSYTVLYWFQNIEDDGYTLNEGETDTERTATTGSWVEANQSDREKGETKEELSPFYGFDYSHSQPVEVKADGNSVLNVYYDREIWTITIYDNPTWREGFTRDVYEKLELQVWKTFSGRYGAKLPTDFPTRKELEEYYTDKSPEPGLVFANLTMPEHKNTEWTSDKMNPSFFSNTGFNTEGEKGTHHIDLFPFYDERARTIVIDYYEENLTLDGYDLAWERIEIVGTGSLYLTCRPRKGFSVLNGYCRTGFSYEQIKTVAWTQMTNPPSEYDAQYNVEEDSYRRHVYDYNEYRLRRVKNDIVFVSGNQEVNRISDVYYETPLKEKLTYKPENLNENMKFAGWYENPDLFEITDPVTSRTMPSTDLILYAKWVPGNYRVTFDTRGGSEIKAQEVAQGSCAFLPEEPTRENCTFAGWYTGDGVRWNFDKQITEDITLYALWKPIPAVKGYTVRHILKTDNSTIAEETGRGFVGDTFIAKALNARDAAYVDGSYIVPDALTKSITLTRNGENEAVFHYDMPDLKDYTVSYLLEGTEETLFADKKITDTHLSRVTEFAEEIQGYTPKLEYQIADLSVEGENKIVFYYTQEKGASLTVSKTVTGKMGDRKKAFTIEITLKTADGNPVSGSLPVSGAGYEEGARLTFHDEGKTTIALSDGESATIHDLETGGSFHVVETEIPAGYEASYNGKASKDGVSGELEETTEVSIVNSCGEIPVTALYSNAKPGMILIISAGALLLASGFVLICRRRKQR